MLQFVGGIFVTNDNGMGMLLQAADGPHVVDRLFYTVTKGAGLVVTIHHNHHLLGIHHCAYTDGQSGLGNQIDIKSGSIINLILENKFSSMFPLGNAHASMALLSLNHILFFVIVKNGELTRWIV